MVISIMQGRLVPPLDGRIQTFPRHRWRDEFPLAVEAGLEGIEWIFDEAGESANPILTDEGSAEMESLATRHGIVVRSVCADYFMDRPLVRTSDLAIGERLDTFRRLLGRCASLGVVRVVLPFVDASRIETADEHRAIADLLGTALMPLAEAAGVEIHLETSLAPSEFAVLLEQVSHPMLKVNYDAGNSASLGYRPAEEFAAYGERVGSVHIKDRVLGGATVPLGTGDTDLRSVFSCLRQVAFSGDFVLQVARGADGDEVEWARRNVAFVRGHLGGDA